MSGESSENELRYEVRTPLGFDARVTRQYWELIITTKHPVMLGLEAEVQEALSNPDEIRGSRSDSDVYLFYKSKSVKRWVCAVAKQLDKEGFLITAYPTDAIKEGRKLWLK